MGNQRSAFWDDLSEDLKDAEFRSEFIRQSVRIATIDRIVGQLDEAREAAGLTKAAVARALDTEPAHVRRLFSSDSANPTLGTISEVAAVLGLQITVTRLSDEARHTVTAPLMGDDPDDLLALGRYLTGLRERTIDLV